PRHRPSGARRPVDLRRVDGETVWRRNITRDGDRRPSGDGHAHDSAARPRSGPEEVDAVRDEKTHRLLSRDDGLETSGERTLATIGAVTVAARKAGRARSEIARALLAAHRPRVR